MCINRILLCLEDHPFLFSSLIAHLILIQATLHIHFKYKVLVAKSYFFSLPWFRIKTLRLTQTSSIVDCISHIVVVVALN
jgi:hypothetical protein